MDWRKRYREKEKYKGLSGIKPMRVYIEMEDGTQTEIFPSSMSVTTSLNEPVQVNILGTYTR